MNHGPAPRMGRDLGHSLFLADASHKSFKSNSLSSYWLALLWTLHSVFNSHWVKSWSTQSALSKELTAHSDCFLVPVSWVMPPGTLKSDRTPQLIDPYKMFSSILRLTFSAPLKKLFIASRFWCLSNHSFAETYPLLRKYDSIKKLHLFLKSLKMWKHW